MEKDLQLENDTACSEEGESCGDNEVKNSTKQDFKDYRKLIYEAMLLVTSNPAEYMIETMEDR